MKDLRVELKVCQGCGVLWVRTVGVGSYCAGCAQWLSDFPAPKGKSRAGRKRIVARAVVRAAACQGGAR